MKEIAKATDASPGLHKILLLLSERSYSLQKLQKVRACDLTRHSGGPNVANGAIRLDSTHHGIIFWPLTVLAFPSVKIRAMERHRHPKLLMN
jgi:hypothetical protein